MAGVGTLSTVECISVISKGAMNLMVKDRLKCPGTTASDFLGPFNRPAKGTAWHIRHKDKGALYGPALTLSAGSVDGDSGPDNDPGPKQTDLVPVCWHGLPGDFYLELQHSYNLKGFIHLTAGDPILPMVCIRKKIPYFGLAHTPLHAELLEKEITHCIFKAMQDPNDGLYEPDLAVLLKLVGVDSAGSSDPSGGNGEGGSGKKKPNAKVTAAAVTVKKLSGSKLLDKLKALDDNEDEDGGEAGD